MNGQPLRVSLVATILNEYGSLPAWIGGLADQTRYPDECIIVDGGSTDGTLDLLGAATFPFPCTVISATKVNISAGRNIAVGDASGDVIVVTDAGTRAEPDWLERLVQPFKASEDTDLVAGFFRASGGNIWTRTLGAATLPDAVEIDRETFLASSRSVAFRRSWFDGGFRYPEWLDYCEDVVFDLQIRDGGARQATALDAVVRFSVRSGPIAFARQYFRYARGDGKAGLFVRRHLIRYLTYTSALITAFRRRPIELAFCLAAGVLYLRAPLIRYRRRNPCRFQLSELLVVTGLIAIQRLIGDVAKMAGYPAGLLWRCRRDRPAKFWKSGWRSRRPDGSLPGA